MATPTRSEWIADARALIDFIEANPELPLNLHTGLHVHYHPLLADDAEAMAAVDAVAAVLGTPVTTPDMPGSHYETEIHRGSASYRVVAVLKDYREKRDAIDRLGEAALAAINNPDDEQTAREYEAHEANEAWLDAHPDEFVADDSEPAPPTVADMRAIFGEPVEGRDYHVMPGGES